MVKWFELSDVPHWDEAIRLSHEFPVCIFKHSTRCGISSMVLHRLEQHQPVEHSRWYMLDLISHRSMSDMVARMTGVEHESPQLLILSDGQVRAHFSHSGIRSEEVSHWLEKLQKKDPVA